MKHSRYGLSSASRWIKCPASVRLQAPYPNTTNPAAEEGTRAHEMLEKSLIAGKILSDEYDIQGCFDHVMALSETYGIKPLLEQRLALSSVKQGLWGTSDCTFVMDKVIHIIDFKYGRVSIEAEDNWQLICYAIGALDTYNKWDTVEEIICEIYQPRAGHLKTVCYTKNKLREYQLRILTAITLADNPETKPVSGSHCKYCKHIANCEARYEDTIETMVQIEKQEIEIGKLEELYKKSRIIKEHLQAVENELLLRGGGDSYQVVDYKGRGKINEEKLLTNTFNHDILYDKKLKGLTELRKILPKELIDDCMEEGETKQRLIKK